MNNGKLANITPFSADGVEITIAGDVVHFGGVISMRNPSDTVTPFLRKIHDAVVASAMKSITVNITKLRFMNSSSIRSLVDWVEWIRAEPEAKRYVLQFLMNPNVTWQTTTLSAIQVLGGDSVVVRAGT
ncbi:MAG TPA: hypothetical protein VHE30_11955 [Polyangiaceae bacterium]|nr:hypothetical protein [Polyangiaceae bacterium]